MKPSYYNVITKNPSASGYLLYNTLHQSLATLDKDEYAFYCTLSNTADSTSAAEKNTKSTQDAQLIDALAEGGFILEDPELEVTFLEYQYDLYKYNTQVLELTIATTLDCNNACVYCYETEKRPGFMSLQVQDAVFAFVQEKYKDAPFSKLKISWFGGEPLLRLDVIEALSQRFIEFCNEHSVEYIAHVITNARLAKADTAKRLAACGVQSVMPSLDGIGARHDCRRCARSGEKTYETIMDNINVLAAEGILVNCSFLTDESNFADFHELGGQLYAKENVLVRATQLRDYHDDEGIAATGIRITTRDEYARQYFKFFMNQNPSAEDIEHALEPIHTFCGTPLHNWWVIDELGGVYKCIGEIGDISRRIFSLMDNPDSREINWPVLLGYMNTSPAKDELCRTCRVLPLCQGECAYERSVFSRNCRTFSFTIENWVQALWVSIEKEAGTYNETSEETA